MINPFAKEAINYAINAIRKSQQSNESGIITDMPFVVTMSWKGKENMLFVVNYNKDKHVYVLNGTWDESPSYTKEVANKLANELQIQSDKDMGDKLFSVMTREEFRVKEYAKAVKLLKYLLSIRHVN